MLTTYTDDPFGNFAIKGRFMALQDTGAEITTGKAGTAENFIIPAEPHTHEITLPRMGDENLLDKHNFYVHISSSSIDKTPDGKYYRPDPKDILNFSVRYERPASWTSLTEPPKECPTGNAMDCCYQEYCEDHNLSEYHMRVLEWKVKEEEGLVAKDTVGTPPAT